MIEQRNHASNQINPIIKDTNEQKFVSIKEFTDINVVINCLDKFSLDLDSNYFNFSRDKANKNDSFSILTEKNSWDSYNHSYEKIDEEKECHEKRNFILLDKETNSSENILSQEDWLKLLRGKNASIYTINREKILYSLIQGVPKNLRGRIWKFLCNCKNISLNHQKNFFDSLLEINNQEVEIQIRKDIERTSLIIESSYEVNINTTNNMSKSVELKQKLFKILKAYAIYDPQVGYCQGSNFIAMILLSNITSLSDAFWTFVQIMHDKNWRLMFINNTPKLMKAFDKLLERIKLNIKDLYEHFESENFIEYIPGVFTHFFTTLFSYNSPIEYTYRIIDLFWFYEDKIIIDCILHLLKLKKKQIIKMSSEDMIIYIKNDLVFSCIKDFGLEKCLPSHNYLIKEKEVII